MLEHPAIAQAAVIGVPHERLGQVGRAVVVLPSPDGAITAGDVIEWSRWRMAGYKAPRYVQFVDELPTNATGKVINDSIALSARSGR